MRVALICTDKAGALQTRLDTRPAHLAYMAETGVVEMAGPLLGADGKPCGSLVILEVEDVAAAEAWAAADPYALAGLFSDVKVIQWNKVVG